MPTFPAGLPSPNRSAYRITAPDQTLRTSGEVGKVRTRRRTKQRKDIIDLTWTLTDEQLATFRAWWDADLNGGAAWFDGVSLRVGDGAQIEPTLRFIGPWKSQRHSVGHWKVTGTLELRGQRPAAPNPEIFLRLSNTNPDPGDEVTVLYATVNGYGYVFTNPVYSWQIDGIEVGTDAVYTLALADDYDSDVGGRLTLTVTDDYYTGTSAESEPIGDPDPLVKSSTESVDEDDTLTGQCLGRSPSGFELTFSVQTDVTEGVLTLNADGSFQYVPTPGDHVGGDSFNFIVTDGEGRVSTAASVTITVNDVNQPPVVPVGIDAGTVEADTFIDILNATFTDQATDPDGDSVTLVSVSCAVEVGTVSDQTTAWRFTPNELRRGPVALDYIVTDGTDQTTGTAWVTVIDPGSGNDPVANDFDFGLLVNTATKTIFKSDLLANAYDPNDDPLTVTNFAIVSGGGLLTEQVAGEQWLFEPPAGTARVVFTWTVTDGTTPATAEATIEVVEPSETARTVENLIWTLGGADPENLNDGVWVFQNGVENLTANTFTVPAGVTGIPKVNFPAGSIEHGGYYIMSWDTQVDIDQWIRWRLGTTSWGGAPWYALNNGDPIRRVAIAVEGGTDNDAISFALHNAGTNAYQNRAMLEKVEYDQYISGIPSEYTRDTATYYCALANTIDADKTVTENACVARDNRNHIAFNHIPIANRGELLGGSFVTGSLPPGPYVFSMNGAAAVQVIGANGYAAICVASDDQRYGFALDLPEQMGLEFFLLSGPATDLRLDSRVGTEFSGDEIYWPDEPTAIDGDTMNTPWPYLWNPETKLLIPV